MLASGGFFRPSWRPKPSAEDVLQGELIYTEQVAAGGGYEQQLDPDVDRSLAQLCPHEF